MIHDSPRICTRVGKDCWIDSMVTGFRAIIGDLLSVVCLPTRLMVESVDNLAWPAHRIPSTTSGIQ